MARLLIALFILLCVVYLFVYLRVWWKKSNEAQEKIDWSKVKEYDDEEDDDDWGDSNQSK